MKIIISLLSKKGPLSEINSDNIKNNPTNKVFRFKNKIIFFFLLINKKNEIILDIKTIIPKYFITVSVNFSSLPMVKISKKLIRKNEKEKININVIIKGGFKL